MSDQITAVGVFDNRRQSLEAYDALRHHGAGRRPL
jgi:hypothetical protein